MKRIVVEFKETYMEHSVIRECEVSSLDIEYWKVLEETDL